MKNYTLDYSGAMEYRNDLYKYYDGQCRKGKWNGMGGYNGWISHFCLDLEMQFYKDPSFLRSLFSFKPYVIGRALLYDSEGYANVMGMIENRMNRSLTNVRCYYTGGGIYVYSALFNNETWLYGGLDNYFGSYDLSGETIEEFHGCDYDSHWKAPSVPYPTWKEILESIRQNCDPSTFHDADRILHTFNSNMNNRCIGDDN